MPKVTGDGVKVIGRDHDRLDRREAREEQSKIKQIMSAGREREIGKEAFGLTDQTPEYRATNVGKKSQGFGKIRIDPGESVRVPVQWAIALAADRDWESAKPPSPVDVEDGQVIQMRRYPGMGDIIFALTAAWNLTQRFDDLEIYFDMPQAYHGWFDWLPFIAGAHNKKPDNFINLDLIDHCSEHDRTVEMLRCCGVKYKGRHKPKYHIPINLPDRRASGFPDIKYAVFAPWARYHIDPRSIPANVINDFLRLYKREFNLPLVVVDRFRTDLPEADGRTVVNMTGVDPLDAAELWLAVRDAQYLLSTDTGVMHMGTTLRVPTVGVFQHIDPNHRLSLVESPWTAVTPDLHCFPCGDGVPRPCESDPDTAEFSCARCVTAQDLLASIERIADLAPDRADAIYS